MAGTLTHSPADVIAALLVDLGLGTDPAAGGDWPVFVGSEPAAPDEVLTVYDTAGRDFGRSMATGDLSEHHGFQVRVRARTHAAGYARARAVAVALDRGATHRAVTLGGSDYFVNAVSRESGPLALGKDVPAGKRSLFTLNCTADLYEC